MNLEIPFHAALRMTQRGATEEEVRDTVENGIREPAKGDRISSRKTHSFNSISPVNHKHYAYKTLEVIWADEPKQAVVVTVKVYYHNS